MSKNMTRKGLALGAGLALVATGLAVPANANGLADKSFVSLLPNQGTQYTVLADNFFDLKANAASGVATAGNLKFLVEDTTSKTKFDLDVDGTIAAPTLGVLNATAVERTINTTAATITANHALAVGDSVEVFGQTGIANGWYRVQSVSTTVSFTITTAETTAIASGAPTVNATFKTPDAANLDGRSTILGGDLGAASVAGASRVQTPSGWDGPNGRKSATDGTYVVNTGVANANNDKVLRLVNTGSDTLSVRVTAWVDANGNGLIDPTEYTSEARTVVFTKVSEATFSTTLTAPAIGASGVEAFVNLGSSFNHSMVGNAAQGNLVAVRFQFNAGSDVSTNAAFNAASGLLRATTASAPFNTIAAGVYNAQARYNSASVGSAAFQTVVAGSVDINNSISTPEAASTADYNGTNLRTGTKTITLASEVTEGSPAVAARSGIPARVTITKVALAASSVITAGGKTLSSTGTSISFDSATNADGEVVVAITSSTGTKDDSITVQVEVLDQTVWRTASKTLTWADAALSGASAVIHLDTVGSNVHRVTKGGSLALRYMVRDTFGQPFVASGYRLSFATTGSVNGGGTVAGTAAVTNGLATFTLVDNTVASTGDYTVRATLERINTAGNGFDVQSGHTSDVVIHVNAPVASNVTATAAMLATTAEASRKTLQTVAYRSGDGRGINITWPYTTAGTASDNYFEVTGKVTASTGAPVPGQAVVISAPGAAVTTAHNSNTAVHGVGSLTVYTNASGDYTAYVYSNKSGKIDITVTAGTATRSTVAYFKKPAVTAGTTLTIDAPTAVVRGSTLTIKSTLVDKFGNGVDAASGSGNQSMTITYTGPGLLVSTPTAYVDGALQFGVLLGANDSGTATVTISVYTGTDRITATRTIAVGNAPASTAGKVNVGSFNGKLVVYAQNLDGKRISWKVGGNWGKATAVGNTLNRFDRPTPRRGVTVSVQIYVDGVLQLTKSVVTR